jgi:hypothetical protein
MKQSYVKILSASVLIAISFSCSKSSNNNSNTCTATTGDAVPLTANKMVPYTASATTGASITTITYQDSAGMTTVNNPPIPFAKSVNLKAGATASISASANISGSGQITVTSNGVNFNTASCN